MVPNRMFQTPKGYTFAKDTTMDPKKPYLIDVDDKIDLHIYSNDGFHLVDVTQSNISSVASSQGVSYLVEGDGEVKMPVIGRIYLKGLNIKEAEILLQEKYSKYYKDPFVIIRIISRQVYIFQGDQGRGTVIQLVNDHTSLFEVLAQSGGISDYGKAYKIKIVRGDLRNPQIYLADVSTLEGLKNSELQIYPNDIIYIDSASNLRKRLTTEFLPYLSVFSSLLVLMTYLSR
jgi:polysaccharide export outer membrane protein